MKALILFLLIIPSLALSADNSSFYFDLTDGSTKTAVHFSVTDPLGRQTGRLPNGALAKQIPGSSYGVESIATEEGSDQGIEGSIFHLREVPAGTYAITILGDASTSYQLTLLLDNRAGQSVSSSAPLQGFIMAGSTQQYVLPFDPTSALPASVVKQVSFASIRQDLQTAFQLGHIGDAKFVAKLDKILAKGEKALSKQGGKDRENMKEAVAKLREFIKKIEKAFKGAEDDDRDDDDKEKPTKSFVSEMAFKALKGDAEALITTLGGKPGKDDDDD
ncbi:MAG: hypothetical protein Q7T82_20230 [Armatimonadota bacterium]|nr:hypothetical protein [Armatimonadota bacterium]